MVLTLPKGVYTADHRIIIICALYSKAQALYQSTDCEERQEEGWYAFVRSMETKVVVARYKTKRA